jgi:hypothetical protein
MGFERRTYLLEFEDMPGFEGLWIRARGATLDEAVDLEYLLELGRKILERNNEMKENRDRYYRILDDLFIEWNRTDDGEPVPCDEKHIRLEELPLLQTATRQWLRAVFTVPPPLSQPSPNGSPPPELFEVMEHASESPPSL